jgi:hypothetical protein
LSVSKGRTVDCSCDAATLGTITWFINQGENSNLSSDYPRLSAGI